MAGRRGNAEGTIYQKQTKRKRKDGTTFTYKHWEAQITTGYYPNGKLRRQCISGKTRKEVADQLKVLLVEQQRDELIDKDNILFKDYLERYLNDHKKIKLRPTTFEKYESLATNHIYPALGSKKLQEIRTADIQNLIREKAGTKSAATVREIHMIVSQALKQACKERLIARNEADNVTLPAIVQQEIIPLTDDEIKALLEAAQGHWLYPALLLELGTGLRRGELLALEWRNVDFAQNAVTITQSYVKTRAGDIMQEPKTKSSIRVVNVPPGIMNYLKEYKKDSHSNYVFSQKSNDKPVAPRNFSHVFESWCAKAGLERTRFHDLRHTYASQLLAENVHMKIVQAQLGHSDIKVTMNRYSHLTQGMQQEAASKLDEKFKQLHIIKEAA